MPPRLWRASRNIVFLGLVVLGLLNLIGKSGRGGEKKLFQFALTGNSKNFDQENELLLKRGWKFPSNFKEDDQTFSSTFEAALFAAQNYRLTVPNSQIPKLIHQTWWSYNTSKQEYIHNSTTSWRYKNQDYFHFVWNDTDIDLLVQHFYPGEYKNFQKLPKPVHKADMFRYIVLNTLGGIYADVDTLCLKPVDQWVRAKNLESWTYKNQTFSKPEHGFNFIIGIEVDVPVWHGEKYLQYYSTPLQITQWAMAASPGQPVLGKAIGDIFNSIRQASKDDLRWRDVTKLTGPAPWTSAVFWSWKGYGIDWKDLRGFGDKSRIIGEQLVLPMTGFSPGLGTTTKTGFDDMISKSIDDEDAYVQHLFKGSWRN
jgi:alpha 1,6-mannosyltransferase